MLRDYRPIVQTKDLRGCFKINFPNCLLNSLDSQLSLYMGPGLENERVVLRPEVADRIMGRAKQLCEEQSRRIDNDMAEIEKNRGAMHDIDVVYQIATELAKLIIRSATYEGRSESPDRPVKESDSDIALYDYGPELLSAK